MPNTICSGHPTKSGRAKISKESLIAKVQEFKNLITLAEKWDMASTIWHNKEENEELLEFLKTELQLKKEYEILDWACGTGEHSLFFYEKGYSIKACDYDLGNISIFKEKQDKKGISIKSDRADWLTINETYPNDKFDLVLCLGSSITYYESWKEDMRIENLSPMDKTEKVLSNLKSLLKPNGKLVLGVSRHYDRRVK